MRSRNFLQTDRRARVNHAARIAFSLLDERQRQASFAALHHRMAARTTGDGPSAAPVPHGTPAGPVTSAWRNAVAPSRTCPHGAIHPRTHRQARNTTALALTARHVQPPPPWRRHAGC